MHKTRGVVSLFLGLGLVAALPAQQSRLLVAQKGLASLAIVDPASGKVLMSVPEGGITGHEVIASPDGRHAFVPIYGNSGVGKPGTNGSKIVEIDLASGKIVGTIDFGHGVRPHCALIGPKDGMLYVTTEIDKTVTIIDPKTLKIVGTISTDQPESHMLVLSHDGRRGYTANVGPGTVSVLDIAARKTIKVIPISGNTQRIAISNDDRWVFTADQTKPQMAVIDTRTNQVAHWIPVESYGYGGAMTPDGKWFLVALPDVNKVAVIDVQAMKVVRNISLSAGTDPQEVLIRPDGKMAYVSCMQSNQVAQIDLGNWTVTRMIATGKATDGLAWAGQ
ncbi:MAG TPA: cytochrome D1 domain-containing protein [Terracidiphilus sp.]|nr:cytochrome D1 domain-containing protein [Terracidiphilus sp.]